MYCFQNRLSLARQFSSTSATLVGKKWLILNSTKAESYIQRNSNEIPCRMLFVQFEKGESLNVHKTLNHFRVPNFEKQ